jgi:hypothetical protein
MAMKYYISTFDGHMILYFSKTFTIDGSKYIAAIFNIKKTQKTIYTVCIYKVHICSINAFSKNL